jgi:hypothetical protein
MLTPMNIDDCVWREHLNAVRDDRPICSCARCGKPLFCMSRGNFAWVDGVCQGVCYACLRPEED